MEEMTWKDIQTKYPDQFVGLIDVVWEDEAHGLIRSAVVKYNKDNISNDDLLRKAFNGEVKREFTTPESSTQLGALSL